MINYKHYAYEATSRDICNLLGIGWGDGERDNMHARNYGYNQCLVDFNGHENGYTQLLGIVKGCGCFYGACDELGRGMDD